MRKSTLVFLFVLVNIFFVTRTHAQVMMNDDTPVMIATTTPGELTTTPEIAQSPEATTTPLLIQKIHEAKGMLSSVTLSYDVIANYKTRKTSASKTQKVITGYGVSNQEIAVAVYDPVFFQITVVKGVQNGKKFSFNDPAVSLRAVGFNGVNTRFTVNRPDGGFVVALKYLITPTSAGSKKSLTSQIKEVVYAPYSEAMNQPDIYGYGNAYIDGAIQDVVDQLHDIRSKVSSGISVASAVEPALIKSLLYAEHMDEKELLKNPDTQGLVNRINTLFAINEDDTFRYSASSASARGISQIIPSTYKSLVRLYPEAHLIPDFIAGTEDHLNAIKATFLLIDDYTAGVKRGLGASYQDAQFADYGAAAYNGGITRVVRAVKRYGDTWRTALKSETTGYVAKIQKLIGLFLG